jgi:hypothetical protein
MFLKNIFKPKVFVFNTKICKSFASKDPYYMLGVDKLDDFDKIKS